MKKCHVFIAVFLFLSSTFAAGQNTEEIKSITSLILRADINKEITIPSRTKAKIAKRIREIRAGKIKLRSIDAFNNYNFCMLANRAIGNLYKSHGCLHVSPVNIILLNELLPVGSVFEIKSYKSAFDMKKVKNIPDLAALIKFTNDLNKLKQKLASKTDVKTIVYPGKDAYIIMLKGKPFAGLNLQGGPKEKMFMLKGRDKKGNPVFDENPALPTPAGKFFIFKKLNNYVSNLYRERTTIPMGAVIKKKDGEWVFKDIDGKWSAAPASIALDIQKTKMSRSYDYFDMIKNSSRNIIQARWAGNVFGSHPVLLSRDMRVPAPELLHTTGDLIIDDYQMLSVMVDLMSRPHETFYECVETTKSFDIYKSCYDFINDTVSAELDPGQSAYYRLYYDMPLNEKELSAIPPDIIIANKIMKNKGPLSAAEKNILIKEGVAANKDGKFSVDMAKIRGLQFYTHQNVIMIKKYANLYLTLRDSWKGLSALRKTLTEDMDILSITDQDIYRRLIVELMVKRIGLQKLTLNGILNDISDTFGL